MYKKVEISHKTIIFGVFFILFLWFLYYIKDILFQIYVAFIISASFNPLILWLQKYKLNRTFAVLVVYLLFLLLAGFSIYILIPALIDQSTSFVRNLPGYMSSLGLNDIVRDRILSELLVQVGLIPSQVAKALISIFSNVLNILTVMIFSFYFSVYRDKLTQNLKSTDYFKNTKMIFLALEKIEIGIGGWARGQLALMFVIGITTYIGLVALNVPYALPLSILAGFFEIVPMIGPFVAGSFAVLIGFGTSFVTGIAVAALAFLIQQFENYLLVPKIMQKSVGLNPVVTLIALAVGFRLFGIIGALVAIPIILTLQVVAVQYFESREESRG